jgi:hypothetical protein
MRLRRGCETCGLETSSLHPLAPHDRRRLVSEWQQKALGRAMWVAMPALRAPPTRPLRADGEN